MKAAAFSYVRPTTLDEVFSHLDGEAVALLAGGQSLVPSLNMRLSAPALVVDINVVAELSGIALVPGALRIGATTRHRELAASPLVAEHAPLLAQAVPHIAHEAIRSRGTIGGSLALADPAAELPACCVALHATVVVASRTGERHVAAQDFLTGVYETALAPGEVIVAIEVPLPPAGSIARFDELARRRGDYAIVGLAAHGVRADGRWRSLDIAFCGAGDRPRLAIGAARALIAGEGLPAAQARLADVLQPTDDGECSASTKMHLARVLLGRVIAAMEQDTAS